MNHADDYQPCLFCGGDASARDHLVYCDGRQGGRDSDPSVDPGGAFAPPPHAEPYTNAGKGIVLTRDSVATKIAVLFDQKPYWTSKELNDRVGWQFSQGIFSLRRRGMRIRTLRVGPHAFAYERMAL